MTTGSVRASEQERKLFAQRTRWWNSTGGGSRPFAGTQSSNSRGAGAIKAGDGGVKFRAEWPELDEENQKWMKENRINPQNGLIMSTSPTQPQCSPDMAGLRKRPSGSATAVGAVVQQGHVAREAGHSWLSRNKWRIVFGTLLSYILVARILGDGAATTIA